MTETSQAGMFALGTPSHAYLEFDAHEGAGPRLVTAIASLREPRTTMGGVNLVTGRVGPTSVYAFMQNVGVINDHVHGCFGRPTTLAPVLDPTRDITAQS